MISETAFLPDGSPEYIGFSVNERTEYLNADGTYITLDSLEVGQGVECYSRHIVLDSYPANTMLEKIILQ